MAKNESSEDVQKRILEAEKVVVSDILFRWRKRYGMDYVIIVRNGPGDVFRRARVAPENLVEMRGAVEQVLETIKATQ